MNVSGSSKSIIVLKAALARAYRVAVYTFAGAAGVSNVSALTEWADLSVLGSSWAFAAVTAVTTAFVAFLVATAEAMAERPLIGPEPPSTTEIHNGKGVTA